ncbi:hypothetical protein RQP53_10000 [Paucibacter sp. APW11]|uniref:Phospholipase/carboxylesterase/thioesterase domain-containing protein n=1 Tax=Roseateles aquae TaxID=3077235 RepID=A0ABU3PAJ5_9BURK|nr:hypothetical protein [Paucibacter sp. APW11]MDT8999597.1 hypothetical protein [Paucibacter sp. APW11]
MSAATPFWRRLLLGGSAWSGPRAALQALSQPSPNGPRQVWLAAPSQPSTAARPTVILLHGFGASGKQLLGEAFPPSPLAHWREIAEREGWLIAAPDGQRQRWNDGFADASASGDWDDVGFIDGLISTLIAAHGADAERIYLMGVSKGGMMSFRLAAELGPRLAAFAPVLASMPKNSRVPAPRHALPLLMIASRHDPLVRYEGGAFRKNRRQAGEMLGIEASLQVWRELAGLGGAPRSETLTSSDCKTEVTRLQWGEPGASLQAVLLRVDGAGHAEPSARHRYPWWINALTGAQNADVDSAEVAFEFFRDKRRRPAV